MKESIKSVTCDKYHFLTHWPILSFQSFGYKEEEKGYYAGIVASAMFMGRACGRYVYTIHK